MQGLDKQQTVDAYGIDQVCRNANSEIICTRIHIINTQTKALLPRNLHTVQSCLMLNYSSIYQVNIWRRSYDIPPPECALDSPHYPGNDRKYAKLREATSIRCESLKVRLLFTVLHQTFANLLQHSFSSFANSLYKTLCYTVIFSPLLWPYPCLPLTDHTGTRAAPMGNGHCTGPAGRPDCPRCSSWKQSKSSCQAS